MTSGLRAKKREGQATLSLVFLTGGIILLLAIGLAVIVLTFLNSGYGYQAANRAQAAAQSGIDDAYLRLARNKDLNGTYSFVNGSYTTSVTVTQNTPIAGQVTVVSSAKVLGYERRIGGVFAVNSITGEVELISWSNMTL